MSLYSLKKDILKMLSLQDKVSMYTQMLIYHNNASDKFNYNPVKCERIQVKLKCLNEELEQLKSKWLY